MSRVSKIVCSKIEDRVPTASDMPAINNIVSGFDAVLDKRLNPFIDNWTVSENNGTYYYKTNLRHSGDMELQILGKKRLIETMINKEYNFILERVSVYAAIGGDYNLVVGIRFPQKENENKEIKA